MILVCGVSLTRPDQLFIGRFNSAKINEEPIQWTCLTGNNELPPTQSLAADVLSFKVEGDMEYEVIKFNQVVTDFQILILNFHLGQFNLPEESFEKDSFSCSPSRWPSFCIH
jgi:hypothetical protein